jgi:hypothetical protein
VLIMYMMSPVVFPAALCTCLYCTCLYCKASAKVHGQRNDSRVAGHVLFALLQPLRDSSSLGLWPCWSCLTRQHQHQLLQRLRQLQATENVELMAVYQTEPLMMNHQLHKRLQSLQQAPLCLQH